MFEVSALFRLLGDDVRLRLLRLVASERLNVSELTTILGIAQSGVSRHLGLLREAGLVREDREGGFTYYRGTGDEAGKLNAVWSLMQEQLTSTDGTHRDVLKADRARLREVKRQRREHRDAHRVAASDDDRQLVPGRSWAAWSRALGLLLPKLRVADLGCGAGHLTLEMASWAAHVVGVDRSPAVLKQARALSRRRGISNVGWRRGTIERVPLDGESVDVAVLSQSLHHADDPSRALAEAKRIVTQSGRVLVLDLAKHEHAWVSERLGDKWLGFERDAIESMMRGVGLTSVTVETGLAEGPFGVLVAVGTRPRLVRKAGHSDARSVDER